MTVTIFSGYCDLFGKQNRITMRKKLATVISRNITVISGICSEEAEEVVRELIGVAGVTNLILVTPTMSPEYIKAQIKEAFNRTAQIDAQRIVIETDDGTVILRGRCVRGRSAQKSGGHPALAVLKM